MRKRAILLSLIMIILGMAFPGALGEDERYSSNGFVYKLHEDGTAEVVRCNLTDVKTDAKIVIPEQLDGHPVTAIDDWAFFPCDGLTEIVIPDSVVTIIPDSVVTMGYNPFWNCPLLKRIVVSPDHPVLATIDGVLFDKTKKSLLCYPRGLTAGYYEIPRVIVEIGDGAFWACDSLTEIVIPNGITSIGDRAFGSCDSLTEVVIPNGVTSIGDSAFWACDSLTKIVIPNGVTSIGDRAFECCDSLTEVVIPDSVTSIGLFAFGQCDMLTLTVGRDSYAAEYAKNNGITYTYPDANDWLND